MTFGQSCTLTTTLAENSFLKLFSPRWQFLVSSDICDHLCPSVEFQPCNFNVSLNVLILVACLFDLGIGQEDHEPSVPVTEGRV